VLVSNTACGTDSVSSNPKPTTVLPYLFCSRSVYEFALEESVLEKIQILQRVIYKLHCLLPLIQIAVNSSHKEGFTVLGIIMCFRIFGGIASFAC
jgi:hypothetical protein